MTKIEELIFAHQKYMALGGAGDRKEKQKVLDEITDEVLSKVSESDITLHVQEVYNATVSEYFATLHNQGVVDELLVFMSMLPSVSEVLDIGCGLGRDALFMSIADEDYRKKQMHRITNRRTTLEKFPIPTKTFLVTSIDSSFQMLKRAYAEAEELKEKGLLATNQMHPKFIYGDMHRINSSYKSFDGIWSCTALFTHTPKSLLVPSISLVARLLNRDGILCLSYTNGKADGRYDKLLLSSTGRIKYFSQPDPDEITRLASQHSLKLISESFNDFEVQGKILKHNLFVTQFFRKI